MRAPALALAVMASLCAFDADAAFFEGVWARSRKDCADTDVPTSRLLIDLSARQKSKTVAMLDGYEHHCLIGNVEVTGDRAKLPMRCYEFYEDLAKQRNGTRSVVTAVRDGAFLNLDGKRYLRCPQKK